MVGSYSRPMHNGNGDAADEFTSLKLVLERTVNDLKKTRHQLRSKNVAVEALTVVIQQLLGKVLTINPSLKTLLYDDIYI